MTHSVKSLFKLWPDRATLAEDIGVRPKTLDQMEWRNRLNPARWPALISSAKKHGLGNITSETLLEINATAEKDRAA